MFHCMPCLYSLDTFGVSRILWVNYACPKIVENDRVNVSLHAIPPSLTTLFELLVNEVSQEIMRVIFLVENDLANVSLYAMLLLLEHFWSCWSMKYWKSSLTRCLFVYKRGKRRHQTASDQAPNKGAWAIPLWMWQFHMIMQQKALVSMVVVLGQ